MSYPVVATRHVSPARVVLVTVGLIGSGALAGAVAGALGATIWLSLLDGLRPAIDPAVWMVSGVVGGALGAVILPIAGFTVLRYVPIGRALVQTVLATAIGGAIGVQFFGGWWLWGALAGFGLAAGRLWAQARRVRQLTADR